MPNPKPKPTTFRRSRTSSAGKTAATALSHILRSTPRLQELALEPAHTETHWVWQVVDAAAGDVAEASHNQVAAAERRALRAKTGAAKAAAERKARRAAIAAALANLIAAAID